MEMEQLMEKGWKRTAYFMTGGLGYYCLELAWRGRSHPSMILVGGVCFLGLGRIRPQLPLLRRMLEGMSLITGVEFLSGCVLNLWLGLNVWDYSDRPGNVLGQICLLYAFFWSLLTCPAMWLASSCRSHLEEPCCLARKRKTV